MLMVALQGTQKLNLNSIIFPLLIIKSPVKYQVSCRAKQAIYLHVKNNMWQIAPFAAKKSITTLHSRLKIRNSLLVLKNIFQHLKRNFVSPCGHVISPLLHLLRVNRTSILDIHDFYTAISKKVVGKSDATIPKGIVGGFEITVLHRNFERMAREAMDYVSEC